MPHRRPGILSQPDIFWTSRPRSAPGHLPTDLPPIESEPNRPWARQPKEYEYLISLSVQAPKPTLLPTLRVSRWSVPPADAHPQSVRRDPLTPLLSAVTVHPQTQCDVTVANSGPTLVLELAVDLTARTGPSHCGAAPGLGSRRRIRASEQPYARHSSSTKTARMPSRKPAGKTVRQSLSPIANLSSSKHECTPPHPARDLQQTRRRNSR